MSEVKMRSDFRVFLWVIFTKYLYDVMKPPTDIQYDIADFLARDPWTHKVIEAFRGIGKSYITAIYCVWRLWLDPTLSILVISASKDRSDALATFMFRMFKEVPFLRHLDPENDKSRGARTSKLLFDVLGAGNKQSPSCKAVGILGMITGSRADIILADDVEIPNNSDTPTKRQKLRIAIEEFEAILRTGMGKLVIFLGTPQSQESIYNDLPTGKHGFKVRMWPAEYPDTEEARRYYGDRLAPMLAYRLDNDPSLAGRPTDTRFNEHELDKRRALYGRSGYALQFLLNTMLSDELKYPLKCRDLIFMDLDPDVHPEKPVWCSDDDTQIPVTCQGFEGDAYFLPMQIVGEWVPYQGGVMAVDPSGRGYDETAYCVLKWGNGYIYILDVGAVPGGFEDDTLKELALIARKWRVGRMLPERNYGGGMFGALMRPVLQKHSKWKDDKGIEHWCSLPLDPKEMPFHTTQKEVRIIETMEPPMNTHRVVVNKALIEEDLRVLPGIGDEDAVNYRFFHQLTRLSRERGCLKHDDRIDAVAMAVADAQRAMGVDPDQNMADNAEARWDAYMDRYMDQGFLNWRGRGTGVWTSDPGDDASSCWV
jgi:hypothetical protein